MPPAISDVTTTRDRLGEVIRRLTVPIKEAPASDSPADLIDAGMSRCSLTYAPPITFVREGTWAKGTRQSKGPGGVGYYPVKLNKDAKIVGTEFEWPQWPSGVPLPLPPIRSGGVVMDEEVISGPVDNGNGTLSKEWKLHIKYVERDFFKPASFYDTRIEFDLLYTVTYDAAKTWSKAAYFVDSIQGPKNDGIIWGDYEIIEKADHYKEVWRTTIGSDGLANFPPSASYPIRNQQTAWAVLRQTAGANEERGRLGEYLRQKMEDDEFKEGWRWDYMDFFWGWAWGDTAYQDIPDHIPDPITGRLPPETLSYYLNAHKTWYQTEFHDKVPVGPGSYPYRDRTASAAASLAYREAVWFWSRAYRMKAVVDTLWREGEGSLQTAYDMLDEAGWDERGPAKSLLGIHGGIGVR